MFLQYNIFANLKGENWVERGGEGVRVIINKKVDFFLPQYVPIYVLVLIIFLHGYLCNNVPQQVILRVFMIMIVILQA